MLQWVGLNGFRMLFYHSLGIHDKQDDVNPMDDLTGKCKQLHQLSVFI